MTAQQAFEAAKAAEAAYYASYEQDALECRAVGLTPATSPRTRALWYAANYAWRKWRRVRDLEQVGVVEEVEP